MRHRILGTRGSNARETTLAVKRASQEIASEDAAKPLAGLGAVLRAGKDYLVRARVMLTAAGGGVRLGYTSDADLAVLAFEARFLGTPGAVPISGLLTSSGSEITGAVDNGDYVLEVEGYVKGANGGTFQLVGAQNTQHANGVNFLIGSYIEFTQLN